MRIFLLLCLFAAAAFAAPTVRSLPQGSRQVSPLDFEERFALSSDRGALLAELIEGTDDFFFYSCLHAQLQGRLGDAAALLERWKGLEARSQRYEEMLNRQALLGFGDDPEGSLAHLRRVLGGDFHHQRQAAGAELNLPTRLDASLLDRSGLIRRALERHRNSLQGFRDGALFGLGAMDLSKKRLGELLDRLQRPTLPNLASLVVRDLEWQKKDDLGFRGIHGRLTLAQLEECVRLRPSLLRGSATVALFLERLRPSDDVDWERDADARGEYLSLLERFNQRLSPAFNSLKAHILHHRLRYDLEQEQLDRARLVSYLRLPRRAFYVAPEMTRLARGQERVNPNQTFATGLPPIGDDEALVRACLAHFFVGDANTAAFDGLLREEYLRQLFAETKLLAGIGERAQWYALLDSPERFEALERRVDLEFAPSQERYFGADDAVTLEVNVKNVPRLLVKVFEIDTFNYYSTLEREVDASIELEGLVPNHEHALEFDAPAIRRVRRSIELAELKSPGVYVVELVGGGVSSRAVIHKSELRFTERLTAAGHAFRVYSENGTHLKGARIWFGGKEHTENDQGEIYLPYSTQPGAETFVVQYGERAQLGRFQHRAEQYRLRADVHVDRESLLAGELAQILVRPALLLNGQPVPLALLEEPFLSIRSRGLDGVEATLEVRELELSALGEYVAEIRVPDGLREISVSLAGSVRSLTRASDEDLHSSPRTFELNRIDATQGTATPILSRSRAGYALDILGKDGEPRVGWPASLRLELEDFTDDQTVVLMTDEKGRIDLGPLVGVRALHATGFPEAAGPWQLRSERRSYPPSLTGVQGEILRVPYMGTAESLDRSRVSLLELRAGVVVRDAFEHVALKDGFLELRGLEGGDYRLHLADGDATVTVRITAGMRRNGWALGASRWLALEGRDALHVPALQLTDDELRVQLINAGPDARVHVLVTRYVPPFDLEADLRGPRPSSHEPYPRVALESDFQSGRALSDEVRYVLDRRFAPHFPGNLLRRPGVLLNPWAVEETTTVVGLGGGAGGSFGGRAQGLGAPSSEALADEAARRRSDPGLYPNLDFLPQGAVVLPNLRPDTEGWVRIPVDQLGDGQEIRVLALDRDDRVLRTILRAERPLNPVTRVLGQALATDASVAERRRIEFLGQGSNATFEGLPGSQVELIDSVAAVFRLFRTLNADAGLEAFAFLLEWPALDVKQKEELYAEFTCHELDLFLFHKDKPFFERVVRPHLANKLDRDFMDDWFGEEDLGGYLDPWSFGRLNILERILLSRRLGDTSIRDHVLDLAALRPEDPAQRRRKFDRLMGAGGLDAQDEARLGRLSTRSRNKSESSQWRGPGDTVLPGGEGGGAATGGAEREEAERSAPPSTAAGLMDEETQLGTELRALGYADQDLDERDSYQALYRGVDPTKRLLETYYYQRTIHEERYGLIPVNGFWRDYAEHEGGAFVSTHLADAAGSLNEMLLALALLDLPFVAPEHGIAQEGKRTTLQAAGPLLVVRRELSRVERNSEAAPILVSQNYYALDEPKRREGNREVDAFVSEEFVVGVAYGCRVVVTNPTSGNRELELLLQIPEGALAVRNGFETRGIGLELGAYGTQTMDYAFYFPHPGTAHHYPAQVTEDERIIAAAESRSLPVVAQATVVDKTSWEYVSQNGTLVDVLAFLDAHQPQALNLERIAWRMRDRDAFEAILDNLRARHVYNSTLWSYALLHGDEPALRESLRHAQSFVARCGRVLNSDLLVIDPVERRTYQRMEFDPLVLARAHEFAGVRDVQNASVTAQYRELLACLTYGGLGNPDDRMELAYFLLLQNRIQEALDVFTGIDPETVKARIQYDYMRCYMAFFGDSPESVRDLAEGYASYPVEHWRTRFTEVVSQLDEVGGASVSVSDPDNRDQSQVGLASREPVLDLEIEAGRIRITHVNLEFCELRFYPMDVELLFSSHPFGDQALDAFGFVQPSKTLSVSFANSTSDLSDLSLPMEFDGSNVVVEVRGGGVVRRQVSYASSLAVRMMENYGQLQVHDAESGAPLGRVYVKVFARMADGTERFHKDGYTDLRGRFDYASLSGSDLTGLQRFSILVLDDERGAEVREAVPPQE